VGQRRKKPPLWIKEHYEKPVAALFAGATAPPWAAHGALAGAIVSGGKGTAAGKIEALREAGIAVAENAASNGRSR